MKRLFIGLLILYFAFSCAGIPVITECKAEVYNDKRIQYLNKGFKEYTSNTQLALYVNETNGEFCIYNKKLNDYWFSNPPERSEQATYKAGVKMRQDSLFTFRYVKGIKFTPQIINSSLMQNSPLDEKGNRKFTVKKIQDGVRYDFRLYDGSTFTGITLPIEIRLKDGYFEARIPVKDIVEEEVVAGENVRYNQDGSKQVIEVKSKNQLLDVNLLPFFNAGTKDDEGYLFIPDGSGAVILNKFNTRGFSSYTQTAYGRDPILYDREINSNRQDVYMPVYGNKVGDRGYFAIIEENVANARVVADTAGVQNGNYMSLETGFSFRAFDTVLRSRNVTVPFNLVSNNLIQSDSAVRFYMLKGERADYNGMAETYRNYLTKEKGLTSRIKQKNPLFLNVVNGMRIDKNILGFKFNIYQSLTTFKQAQEMVTDFRSRGIDEMLVELTGWTKDGIDTGFINDAVPVGSIGGIKGFNEFARLLSDKNIQLYPSVDLLNVKTLGNGFSFRKDSVRMINKVFSKEYEYNLATGKVIPSSSWFITTPSSIQKAFDLFNLTFGRLNMKGLSLTSLGSQLQSDNNEYNFIYRSSALDSYIKQFDALKSAYGNLLVHDAKAYAFGYADAITGIPLENTPYDIIDYGIPFYAMVLHGFVPYAGNEINLSGNQQRYFLKSLEAGACLNYTLMYEKNSKLKDTKYNHLYSINYNDWTGNIAQRYGELSKIYEKIYNQKMMRYERLSEGLASITYENGITIVINFNNEAKTFNTYRVEPQSYIILNGGKKL